MGFLRILVRVIVRLINSTISAHLFLLFPSSLSTPIFPRPLLSQFLYRHDLIIFNDFSKNLSPLLQKIGWHDDSASWLGIKYMLGFQWVSCAPKCTMQSCTWVTHFKKNDSYVHLKCYSAVSFNKLGHILWLKLFISRCGYGYKVRILLFAFFP